jgi:hypothetical protein
VCILRRDPTNSIGRSRQSGLIEDGPGLFSANLIMLFSRKCDTADFLCVCCLLCLPKTGMLAVGGVGQQPLTK